MISIFLPLRWELLLSQRAMLSIVAAAASFAAARRFERASERRLAPGLRVAVALPPLEPLARRRGHTSSPPTRWSLLLPQCLSRSALAGSIITWPLRWALKLSQLALSSALPLGAHLSLLQPYALRRLRRCCRCGRSLIKPPQTETTAGHTHTRKARKHTTRRSRKVANSGVAVRTRLGHERGGSLLQLAQLQTTTTPKHAWRCQ